MMTTSSRSRPGAANVKFTNLGSEEVDVYWEIVVPLSPFSSKVGEFSLDSHETYTLQAYGGQKGGPDHRLYYKAESDDHEQEGYVDQWKYCKKPLVKTSVQCGYVTFTNVFNHRVKVRVPGGPRLRLLGRRLHCSSSAGRRRSSSTRRCCGSALRADGATTTIGGRSARSTSPSECEEYKKHDDDDDDDEWELHDAGDFILKIIPFTDGPLLDTSTFGGLFRR